jgi:nitroimidazol reductase NimA-like FMN-containing flavoprotein (pyridoxamine 5'-phosphate oxidase superfamily)
MPKDYLSLPYAHVRRSDRAVEDEGWIRSLLHRAPVGTLATLHDDQPFLNMNLFVFDEAAHAIYMHTARVGRTAANIAQFEKVCFGVNTMGRLLPAEEALEFSVEYSGVVVFGRGSIVRDSVEAKRCLQMLLDKYFPHLQPERDYRPIIEEELARTSVYRIDIDSWSGKKKEVAEDFPGAFFYDNLSQSDIRSR